MTPAGLSKYCLSLPGATHDVKWGVDQCYSVGGKMFAVCNPTAPGGDVSFKVDDGRFLELTDREGFIPAPYLARAKWVRVTDLRKVGDAEMKALLKRSYELIAAKLSKKLRESF